MGNYIFNGDFPTMQDTLCAMATRAMAEFSNVGQPSYEEQRKFVENAHITFKEIDNLDEWKKKYSGNRTVLKLEKKTGIVEEII